MVEVEFPRNGLLNSTCPEEVTGAITENTSNTTNNTGFQSALFIGPPNSRFSEDASNPFSFAISLGGEFGTPVSQNCIIVVNSPRVQIKCKRRAVLRYIFIERFQ